MVPKISQDKDYEVFGKDEQLEIPADENLASANRVPAVEDGMEVQAPVVGAQQKEEDTRKPVCAAKEMRRVTRSMTSALGQVPNLALVAIDDFGAETFIPWGGINLAVPKTITGALAGHEARQWQHAIEEEMQSIREAGTLSDPVELPDGCKAVGLKFIFVKKVGEDGMVSRYKARLVYNHLGDRDTDENNYAPVVNKVSLRAFLAAVASRKWDLVQADVKTAFLNADNPGLEYVRLPKEVVDCEQARVRILKKALYGLQRAPRMWHFTFSNWAKGVGFRQSEHDPCMFMHETKGQFITIYVDDMLLAADGESLMRELCDKLLARFRCTIMGTPAYFLGMNVNYRKDDGVVLLTQRTYVEAVVQKFGLLSSIPRKLPMQPGLMLVKQDGEDEYNFPEYGSLVGALLFLSVCTRPDISFAVGVLAKFVSNPGPEHWKAAVELTRYLKGSKDNGIVLGGGIGEVLCGYADSDWGSDVYDRVSVSGGIIFWGSNVLSWFSRKQSMVCLSTAEAESHAMVDVGKELVYVQRVVGDIMQFLGLSIGSVPRMYSDNQPALDAIINGKGRTKHYDLRIKYLAFGIASGLFSIEKVASVDNIADLFTKTLKATRFGMLAGSIMSGAKLYECTI
jgi:hypothetical protein